MIRPITSKPMTASTNLAWLSVGKNFKWFFHWRKALPRASELGTTKRRPGGWRRFGRLRMARCRGVGGVDAELTESVTFSPTVLEGDCRAMPIPSSTYRALTVRHSLFLSRMRSFWALLAPHHLPRRG